MHFQNDKKSPAVYCRFVNCVNCLVALEGIVNRLNLMIASVCESSSSQSDFSRIESQSASDILPGDLQDWLDRG